MAITDKNRRELFDQLEGRFDSAFADLKVSTERLFTGAIAANVIAVVTALVT